MSTKALDTSKEKEGYEPESPEIEEGAAKPAEKKESISSVPFWKLLSTADGRDVFLMLIGTIGAMGNGVLLPLFAIVFGQFTDALGGTEIDKVKFMHTVSDISLKFLYLAIAAAIGSYLEAGVWMYTGNRQANRLRTRFLAAVLNQDVSFFDVHSTTGGLVQGLNEDSIDVQNAISEKMGSFIHHA
ncbi:ABC transporter B family member 19 [Tetrabaena socialis]|uniref:ABC transporter B family member 19 n=1 Tax=Tetrabaena socialis TaxID=47790 RepID=A0A2J8ACF0_9CHLO|nr:ABC transporter B family member 19 [Tetrabaena socialis]|eukprot:PNH10194.1 ABC transporter B family member 19 [Tetrabaena socialis]